MNETELEIIETLYELDEENDGRRFHGLWDYDQDDLDEE